MCGTMKTPCSVNQATNWALAYAAEFAKVQYSDDTEESKEEDRQGDLRYYTEEYVPPYFKAETRAALADLTAKGIKEPTDGTNYDDIWE